MAKRSWTSKQILCNKYKVSWLLIMLISDVNILPFNGTVHLNHIICFNKYFQTKNVWG